MTIDPNHRALLRAVGKLTTQVGRIADTLADGTARDTLALAPPVVTDDDGAQTTGDDDRPRLLGDSTPLPWPAPPYKLCSASSHGALGATVGPCVLRYLHEGPVHVGADGTSWAQTTGHDTPTTSGAAKQRTIRRQQFRLLLNQLNAGVTPLTTGQVQALTAYVADEIVECNMETQEADRLEGDVKLLRAELDRIYTPRNISTMGRPSLTIGDQLAMAANLEKITAALDRVRAIKPSPPRSEANARTNAQDEGWDQALLTVRAALIGPIADDS